MPSTSTMMFFLRECYKSATKDPQIEKMRTADSPLKICIGFSKSVYPRLNLLDLHVGQRTADSQQALRSSGQGRCSPSRPTGRVPRDHGASGGVQCGTLCGWQRFGRMGRWLFYPDATHGSAIFADQLGWSTWGQCRHYMAYMECLG